MSYARALAPTLLTALLWTVTASADWIHPFDLPQPAEAPTEILGVVEISAQTFTKYELDKKTGYPVVDRFVAMPMAYPLNYGSVPSTLNVDGDPLDFLVFSREPIVPGALIKVRPVAVLRNTDGGEQDDKLICVPATKIDPTYEKIVDLAHLAELDKQRLEQFFANYKTLASKKKVEILGWGDAKAAQQTFTEAAARYAAAKAAEGSEKQ